MSWRRNRRVQRRPKRANNDVSFFFFFLFLHWDIPCGSLMYNNMFLFHHFVYLLIKLNKGDVYCQKNLKT